MWLREEAWVGLRLFSLLTTACLTLLASVEVPAPQESIHPWLRQARPRRRCSLGELGASCSLVCASASFQRHLPSGYQLALFWSQPVSALSHQQIQFIPQQLQQIISFLRPYQCRCWFSLLRKKPFLLPTWAQFAIFLAEMWHPAVWRHLCLP